MTQPTISVKDASGGTVVRNAINNNGQDTSANSQPVVIASDQSAVPVTASSLPLAPDASTASAQGTAQTTLDSIDTKTPALASGRVPVDGSGVTQPVSASSLPLPTGAATSANQTTANSSLSSIDGKLAALSGGKVPVTDPTALPLPTGAATSANQTTANSSLSSIDGKLAALSGGKVPVTDPTALPLPTGAATSANQTTANSSLSSIDGKLAALSGGKVPVTDPTALPLPAGAAISAKQAALGTLGTPSSDVLSIQGGRTNNNAAPGGELVPTMTSLANAATPSWTEGRAVMQSVDLSGNTRVIDSRLPTALGQSAAASSLAVTLSNENIQDVFITGQSGQSVLNNNIMLASAGSGWIDTLGSSSGVAMRAFYCQIEGSVGITGGTLFFEGSNDQTNAVPLPVFDESVVTGTVTNVAFSVVASAHRFFGGKCKFRYIRCRIAFAFAGGTVQAFTRLSPLDYTPSIVQVSGIATNFNSSLTAGVGQGHATSHHLISAASTNATSVKGSNGTIGSLVATNLNVLPRYIKLYSKASAPTVGTDTPVATLLIPPGGSLVLDCGGFGIRLSTGIAYALTTGITVADTGAVSASEHSVFVQYT